MDEGGVILTSYEIVAPSGEQIATLADWHKYAAPFRPDLHWKDGKSAKELAKYVLLNAGIHRLLKELGISYNGKLFCYPEHVTNLPGRGNGRNHDLFIVSESGDLVIGVEAKTDESFGIYCKDIENPSENKKHRITAMKELVFKNVAIDCSALRYQLLTAAAGTILEAKHYKSKQVYLVVLTFEKEGYTYNTTQMLGNKRDFNDLKKVLSSIRPELHLRYIHEWT